MDNILEKLFELKDEKYAVFSAGLNPTLSAENVIGVRVPLIRKLAKQMFKEKQYEEFISQLPHTYLEENMLHALLINEMKDYHQAAEALKQFCPYIDNWAVCDSIKPTVFAKNTDKLMELIQIWLKDEHEYICRLAIEMLMTYYLDDCFDSRYLKMVAEVKRTDYYVEMMIAWYFATALAKHWDESIIFLQDDSLSFSVFRKTVQKCIDSFRISDENKKYLQNLRKQRTVNKTK